MALKLQANLEQQSGFRLDIDMTFKANEVSALFGPSGSGKSTILRLLAGLEKRDNVNISFGDTVWQDSKTFVPAHQRRIGYIFQDLNLFPHMSIEENLSYAEARRHNAVGLGRTEILEILDIGNLLRSRPSELSGGEQQRVAMARALLSNPDLLVMDEPLGSLDQSARDRILPYLQRLHRTLAIPVVYVSHSIDEVLYFADSVFEISDGRINNQQSVIEFSTGNSSARQADASAIVRCTVRAMDTQFALTELDFEASPLFVSSDNLSVGDSVRVKIPARDVSLSREQTRSSIVNVLPSVIDEVLDPDHGPSVLIKLKCGSQFLLSRITRKSLQELNLKPGEPVFAQIKGVALMTQHDR